MLRAGRTSSMSCKVFAVWRPCFVRVVPAVCHICVCCLEAMPCVAGLCHVILLLFDDHAILICMLYNFCY